jgi:hypothetical protein
MENGTDSIPSEFFYQTINMVNKPQPKNYSNFGSYSNAVRQWYLNKPKQSTNTLQLFTNALQNYFREHGGPSNQQNMINREVIKLYKSLNNFIKTKIGQRPNAAIHEKYYNMIYKLKIQPYNSLYKVHENLKKIKRKLQLQSVNNSSLKTFSKIFEKETGTPLGPAYNIIKKKLTSWKPTGKYANWAKESKILRNPNTGNVGYMTSSGKWVRWNNSHPHYYGPGNNPVYLKNLNIWRNEDGTIWVHINGKWRKFNFK